MTETQRGIGVHGEDVPALLDRWARLGLLSPEQVEQILRAEGISAAGAVPAVRPAPPVPEPRPTPPPPEAEKAAPSAVEAERGPGRLAVEALGYLGGVLALAAGLLLVQLVWEDLSTAARLAIPLVASALLLLAGALVPTTSRDAEGMLRLRSVLWLLAVAAWGATFGVLGDQVLEADAEDTMLLVGLGALGLALPLYYATHSAAQQFAVFGSAVTTVIAIGTRPDWEEPTFVGLAGWLLALAWFVAAERKLVSPPLVGRYLGALGAVFFVLLMAGTLAGQLIALATIAALFVWAVRVDSVGLLAVAAYGTLQAVPSMVNYFFPDNARVVIPLGLLAAGGVLVGTAVLISRRRTRRQSAAESDQHARR